MFSFEALFEKLKIFLCFKERSKGTIVKKWVKKIVLFKTMLLVYFKRFTLIFADMKRINFSNLTKSHADHEEFSSNMVNGKS